MLTTTENRLAKMHEELDDTAVIENGFDFPTEPGRYLVIMRTMGDRIWAINCETLDECATAINEDDTDREEALILDLDTDTEHVPILEVVKIMVYGGPDWTRPEPTGLQSIREILETRFPFLKDPDAEANGADVVDELTRWYNGGEPYTYTCTGCGREESVCSANPCPGVIADRAR